MMITFLTIVLDGQPWITEHYPVFRRLPFDWQWMVVEGVAAPEQDTSWVNRLSPRLSEDGTTQYLDSINDPRVIIFRKEFWHGKVHMVNEPLQTIYQQCLLWEVDSDEIWTVEQICKVREMFMANPLKNCAYFLCDYRVGRNLRIQSRDCYGNYPGEWLRVWRWTRNTKFKTHEPPKMDKFDENPFTRDETEAAGCVFRHEAYSTEKQLAFKEHYYAGAGNPNGAKYKGAVSNWHKLQRHQKFPVKLQVFMPWVDDRAIVERVSA
jgi:hypothetical protein